MLLSLFCGAGGLDLGFETAGFSVGLAFDRSESGVLSYNYNRPNSAVAHCRDVRKLSLNRLDELHGDTFRPEGVIGGPPCQSFSQANRSNVAADPRHTLPRVFAKLLSELNSRAPVKFFVLENVPGLASAKHKARLRDFVTRLSDAGFNVSQVILNAEHFNTPQTRRRLFLVGFNTELYGDLKWVPPHPTTTDKASVTVAAAIKGLREPAYFKRDADPFQFPEHPNHWCMQPKSKRFKRAGLLIAGDASRRSFKTLSWQRPSLTVAYGNREVHIHPKCHRRLSVFEAMKLQGFPDDYVLLGTLSSQITQVSEAVPPPLARAVADSIKVQLKRAEESQKRSRQTVAA